jgi:hypothetical protein
VKDVAVSGYGRGIVTIVGVSPQGTVADVSLPSTKVLAEGSGVLLDGHQIQVSGITDPGAGATIPDPGPYTTSFAAVATKTKISGSVVLRVDDETGIVNATPQIPGSPPVPFPVSFKFKITSGGQVKVRAR